MPRRRIFLSDRHLGVTVKNARRAGLCELGIRGLLHRVGPGGRADFSGRLLAAL